MFDVTSWVTRFQHENNFVYNESATMQIQATLVLPAWHCIYTWQMTGEQMRAFGVDGQSVCFVVMLDEAGHPLRASDLAPYCILSGWEGMRPEDRPAPIKFEDKGVEPPANMAIFQGAKYWIEIDDTTGIVDSDRVTGITATNPADKDPNSHHCSVVVFQRVGLNRAEPDDRTVQVSRADLEMMRRIITSYLEN